MNATSSSLASPKDMKRAKGYRFHPTEEELINHYLQKKMLGYENQVSAIAEVDICKYEPWELPMKSKLPSNDYIWYFFGRPDYKYRNSKRANRKTKDGYWKVTGKKRSIKNRANNKTIGIKKNLVFYRGRVPEGVKTTWIIHEYHPNSSSSNGRDFVICRLKQKSRDKIDNSTIDKGESRHDATSVVENHVNEITFPEIDLQFLEEFLSSNEEDFNSPDAHQPEMCMEQGPQSPSVGNLQNTNSFTDNYNVPLPQFGTSDLQDNITKWMNSSTANQDVYSIDGSIPTPPNDSSPSESFGSLFVDDIGGTEEIDTWVNSCFESAFEGYSFSNT
ncbi:NAC domain-containing protein 71-like [Tripterygium wilfordii]|uniref:NAC domain-containing protein 71-like n=1 Tax=Tripterygium wilfordii TaxID=458696 RepID=UPI0018F7F099|nr:NAC domain-containing protein 71-like [Tripterygium wilfordii]XP_038708734.1 NAC domain-containing protein 71-like [Tripterygium wilfordii]